MSDGYATEDLLSVLTELGAKGGLILHAEIPSLKLQSWNALLSMPLRNRLAIKSQEKEMIMKALDTSSSSSPTAPGSSTTPTPA